MKVFAYVFYRHNASHVHSISTAIAFSVFTENEYKFKPNESARLDVVVNDVDIESKMFGLGSDKVFTKFFSSHPLPRGKYLFKVKIIERHDVGKILWSRKIQSFACSSFFCLVFCVSVWVLWLSPTLKLFINFLTVALNTNVNNSEMKWNRATTDFRLRERLAERTNRILSTARKIKSLKIVN